MTRQRALQSTATQAEQPHSNRHRIYTVTQLLGLLQMSRRTFFRLRSLGELPFLVELEPRLGRVIRYRADLVDQYLDNRWGRSRFFASHARQSAAPAVRRSTSIKEA